MVDNPPILILLIKHRSGLIEIICSGSVNKVGG
ncbi:MAG: hypothetical protein HW380_3661 [Magnetococcales bacterium]|nr:hypothetical protein [Magnetococcales bacterium]